MTMSVYTHAYRYFLEQKQVCEQSLYIEKIKQLFELKSNSKIDIYYYNDICTTRNDN